MSVAGLKTVVSMQSGLPVSTFRLSTPTGVQLYDCNQLQDYAVEVGMVWFLSVLLCEWWIVRRVYWLLSSFKLYNACSIESVSECRCYEILLTSTKTDKTEKHVTVLHVRMKHNFLPSPKPCTNISEVIIEYIYFEIHTILCFSTKAPLSVWTHGMGGWSSSRVASWVINWQFRATYHRRSQ